LVQDVGQLLWVEVMSERRDKLDDALARLDEGVRP
jgi:hypothetical protein